MGLILDISPRTLEKVLYFASYIVLDPGSTSLQYKQVLSEKEYREEVEKYGGTGSFPRRNGRRGHPGTAERPLIWKRIPKTSEGRWRMPLDRSAPDIIKRLEVVEAFLTSGNHPEVDDYGCDSCYPPDIRPMVQLDGGRFATSDLNDLYRRIINQEQPSGKSSGAGRSLTSLSATRSVCFRRQWMP